MKRTSTDWPPECCVPAFFEAALGILGYSSPERAIMSRGLNVHVGPADENPFDLDVSVDPYSRGLDPVRSVDAIEAFFARVAPSIGFCYVPFNKIAFEMYQEVARQALINGCVVGVGLCPKTLTLPALTDRRHVIRLCKVEGEHAYFVDDSKSEPAQVRALWETIEHAVKVVNGGFWILGARKSLSLEYC